MRKEEIQDLANLQTNFVIAVCALEEYVEIRGNISPLEEVCVKQMRVALDDFERYINECRREG